MVWDLSVDLIQSTVKIEQPMADGRRAVGTGFLVSDPTPDGRPRVMLVTAKHVLQSMPKDQASLGFRAKGPDNSWTYTPQAVEIRDPRGLPLWTSHPTRDVAAIVVNVPPELAKAAIPLNYLAEQDTLSNNDVGLGDEMMALGFPRGLAANNAGFAILRSGRVASYPLGPSDNAPTFLMDFSVFPGNSGGPVFVAKSGRGKPAGDQGEGGQFIAGILTQEVELNNERLGIGIVTHARFVRETLAMFDGAAPPSPSPMTMQPLTGDVAFAAETAVP
ncbi:MAG TPA: serine protease [Caulobacteraceae bacterium]|jgi:S1-C subfamily serine protease|nr:serine protease [Caulobacteraceae bacterium]